MVSPAQIKIFSQRIGIRAKNDRKDASVIALSGLGNNPPPWKPEYRELRALPNRLNALETDIRREKNRLEKVISSHSSESVTASPERTIGFPEKEKKALQDQIRKHIGNHPDLKKDRSLLQSVPGIGPVVSGRMTLLLQNGKKFGSAPKAASYIRSDPD